MKKNVACFILLIIPLFSLFAENECENKYFKANILLNSTDVLDSADIPDIKNLTIDMSSMEKNMLYDSNKREASLPFMLNCFVGFGIGSYVQGDTKGGNVALLGNILSFSMLIAGYSQYNNSTTSSNNFFENNTLFVLGSVGFISTKIFEIIRPFIFSSSYNNRLSQEIINVAVAPKLINTNDLGMNLSYTIAL